MSLDEPEWKKTKLSLERPYKDDSGARIPVLLDITPEGEQIFEPVENPTTVLGDNLRRIFFERGTDFFERQDQLSSGDDRVAPPRESSPLSEDGEHTAYNTKLTMSPEQLFRMRTEITPHLFIALGEMTQAKDLLSFLLASSSSSKEPCPVPSLPSNSLTASMVSKPSAISSVDAFNAQLTIGGKDEALRKAADVFKQAASRLERSRLNSEKYWVDALKIRKANWSLVPAPLPVWAPSGKGSDRTSKDFLISFGLEESPKHFRRKAVAHLSTLEVETNMLVFPHRQSARIRISLAILDPAGVTHTAHSSVKSLGHPSLEATLTDVQREIVDEEMFSVLIREASTLPTSSARVAERIIIIDVDHGSELRFEMIDVNEDIEESRGPEALSATCDLIHGMLQALLLTAHSRDKSKRVSASGSERLSSTSNIQSSSELLQPVIDLLQYQQFCVRIKTELDKMVSALTHAGVPCSLRFHPVGEPGQSLQLRLLSEHVLKRVGGEALLRIDERQTLRLTFLSPSSLVAHLPQATLPITSVPQLSQLLSDEVERCLLAKLCESGSQYSEQFGGTWFVDMVSGKTIGRWEGCIVNFSVSFTDDFAICSSAYRIGAGKENQISHLDTYSVHQPIPLIAWQLGILEKMLTAS